MPAAFVLILHQTLLMGAAMLGGVAFERGGQAARQARASATAILGQGLAHWTLYVPAMLLYFVVMPRVYGFSTLGSRLGTGGALGSLHPGDELPGAGARPGVPPPRDRGAARAGEQPAAVLPGRRVLAGRGTAGIAAAGARTAAERQRDRRHRPHQPDGREPCRGAAGLAAPLGAHAALFRRRHGHGAASHGSEAESMLRPSRRALLLAAVPVLAARRCRASGTGGRRGRATLSARDRDGADHRDPHRPRGQWPAWRASWSHRDRRCSAGSRWRC